MGPSPNLAWFYPDFSPGGWDGELPSMKGQDREGPWRNLTERTPLSAASPHHKPQSWKGHFSSRSLPRIHWRGPDPQTQDLCFHPC